MYLQVYMVEIPQLCCFFTVYLKKQKLRIFNRFAVCPTEHYLLRGVLQNKLAFTTPSSWILLPNSWRTDVYAFFKKKQMVKIPSTTYSLYQCSSPIFSFFFTRRVRVLWIIQKDLSEPIYEIYQKAWLSFTGLDHFLTFFFSCGIIPEEPFVSFYYSNLKFPILFYFSTHTHTLTYSVSFIASNFHQDLATGVINDDCDIFFSMMPNNKKISCFSLYILIEVRYGID